MNGIYKVEACVVDPNTMMSKPFKTVVMTSNDKIGKSLSIEYEGKLIMIPMDEIWERLM